MKSLKDLMSNPKDEKRILEHSCIFGGTLEDWIHQRKFITNAIHCSGSILDIGCANGLLLSSLMEWSQHKLIPYGIDPDHVRLAGVSDVLPEFKNNFAPLKITQLEQLPNYNLPSQFDLVYWNVWDNFDFSLHQHFISPAFKAVKLGGRLILGFYHDDVQENLAEISCVKKLYPDLKGEKDNSPNTQMIIWYDL